MKKICAISLMEKTLTANQTLIVQLFPYFSQESRMELLRSFSHVLWKKGYSLETMYDAFNNPEIILDLQKIGAKLIKENQARVNQYKKEREAYKELAKIKNKGWVEDFNCVARNSFEKYKSVLAVTIPESAAQPLDVLFLHQHGSSVPENNISYRLACLYADSTHFLNTVRTSSDHEFFKRMVHKKTGALFLFMTALKREASSIDFVQNMKAESQDLALIDTVFSGATLNEEQIQALKSLISVLSTQNPETEMSELRREYKTWKFELEKMMKLLEELKQKFKLDDTKFTIDGFNRNLEKIEKYSGNAHKQTSTQLDFFPIKIYRDSYKEIFHRSPNITGGLNESELLFMLKEQEAVQDIDPQLRVTYSFGRQYYQELLDVFTDLEEKIKKLREEKPKDLLRRAMTCFETQAQWNLASLLREQVSTVVSQEELTTCSREDTQKNTVSKKKHKNSKKEPESSQKKRPVFMTTTYNPKDVQMPQSILYEEDRDIFIQEDENAAVITLQTKDIFPEYQSLEIEESLVPDEKPSMFQEKEVSPQLPSEETEPSVKSGINPERPVKTKKKSKSKNPKNRGCHQTRMIQYPSMPYVQQPSNPWMTVSPVTPYSRLFYSGIQGAHSYVAQPVAYTYVTYSVPMQPVTTPYWAVPFSYVETHRRSYHHFVYVNQFSQFFRDSQDVNSVLGKTNDNGQEYLTKIKFYPNRFEIKPCKITPDYYFFKLEVLGSYTMYGAR